MAVDKFGNPIFNTEQALPLTPFALPAPATTPTGSSLQSLIDSLKAPELPKVPDTGSNTLSLLLGALGNRAQATPSLPSSSTVASSAGSAGQKAYGQIPASTKAAKAANLALTQQGVKYVWGGNAWGSGLDCSGLVQQSFKRVGISVPRTTYDQWKVGAPVAKNKLQPGDAVFFHPGSNGPEHVGIYIGKDQFVESPHTGDVTKVVKFSTYGGYMGARRYR